MKLLFIRRTTMKASGFPLVVFWLVGLLMAVSSLQHHHHQWSMMVVTPVMAFVSPPPPPPPPPLASRRPTSTRSTSTSTSTSSRTRTTTQLAAAAIFKPSSSKVSTALSSNNFVRGKLCIVTSKIFVSPIKYKDILCNTLLPNTYWPEVALIVAMVRSMDIAKWLYRKRKLGWSHGFDRDEPTTIDELEQQAELDQAFQNSKSLQIARAARQIGTLQATLYVSDVALVVLKLLGFKFVDKCQAQKVAGSVIFSLWFARTLSQIKYLFFLNPARVFGLYARVGSMANINKRGRGGQQQQQQQLLPQQLQQLSEEATRMEFDEVANVTQATAVPATSTPTSTTTSSTMGVYNRFANRVFDVILYFSAFINVVDLLGFHVGFALKSIFGLGSFGTLVLSLASRDVAAEFVGGLMVQSSNFLDEGEVVVLQDGTRGSITKIGWLFTYILKKDEKENEDYIVRVPNSQISHQRIARVKRVATKSRRGGYRRKRFY